jgi:transposase-like protein
VPRKYRQHTEEFKLEAVKLLTQSGKSIRVLARELGVDRSSLYRWRDEFDPGHLMHPSEGVAKGKPTPRLMSQDEEVRALRRQNEVLREERDFLKKAAAFFAKESR